MKNRIETLLFSLLRCALCDLSLSEEERAQINEETLGALYALSKSQDVAQIVGYALSKEKLLGKESAFAAKFGKQQMVAMLRQERLDYELSQIRSVLEEAKLRFLPLKGSVIRSLYPVPWLRTSCDIDVLVDEARLDECVALLCEKLGYQTDGVRQFHDISLHAPSGVHLELHFNILENMETLDRELARVWEFAAPISDGAAEHRLTNEYLVFHSVAHMAYHLLSGGCGIKPFLDIFVLERKLNCNEERLNLLLEGCGLCTFAEQARKLSNAWFGDGEHTSLTNDLQSYVLNGGVYGTVANKVSVQQAKHGGKIGYFFSRIFLSYDVLSQYYPILRRHKYLFPLMQIRRWGRVIFGGKFHRSVNELKVNSAVNKAQVQEMNSLFQKLGL